MATGLNIFYCKAEAYVVVGGDDERDYCELDTIGDVICTTSRGKARAMFAWQYNLDFTYPMSIRKVQHTMAQCDLADEWWMVSDGYYVDDDLTLQYYDETKGA